VGFVSVAGSATFKVNAQVPASPEASLTPPLIEYLPTVNVPDERITPVAVLNNNAGFADVSL
jgi:hypothetical protein